MVEEAGTFAEVTEEKRRSPVADIFIRMLRQKPLGTLGGIIVIILLFTGILSEQLAPYGFNEINLAHRLEAPSPQFVLGTDNLGRDMLSRIIYGARISVIVGLCASLIAIVLGTLIGTLSGFWGGKVDIVLQRFVDAWMCFPALFIILTVMALLGSGMVQVIFILGILNGIRSSRVMRGAVIGIKENVYIEAARSIGCPTVRMLARHVLPNIMAPIIVTFTVSVGSMILAEASISFLGYGIPPPQPSWGGMLSGSGRQFMLQAPWMAIWPGVALSVVVYGMNMFGDAVRDLLDPRLRGGLGRYGGTGKRGKKKAKKE